MFDTLKSILAVEIYKGEKFVITIYTVIVVFLILLITKLFVALINKFFKRFIIKKRIDSGRGNAIFQMVKYLIWIFSISMILETSGVKITFLLAGSAALLVGLGLGLQQIFMDILSGIVILFEGTLKVEDIVQLEDEMVGKVKQIGLRVSYIETRDNIIMIIPNSKFVNGNVINWSHMEKLTRFSVSVGVAYGTDVRLVERVLLECTADHKDVSNQHLPFVKFNDFGDSSLDFQVHFWTHETFWVERIKSDLRYAINDAFIKNNIQIPFPQRDLHIRSGFKD